MSISETFTHRTLELLRAMWDAILEEEAILEESGPEPVGLRVAGGAMPDEADRNQPHFER